MSAAGPTPTIEKSASTPAPSQSDLIVRICSSLVLAPLALVTAYVGGWLFALFWGAAAIGVFIEWSSLVQGRHHRWAVLAGGVALALAVALTGEGRLGAAVIVIVLGVAAVAVTASTQRIWTAAGVAYAGVLVIAPIALRHDAVQGWPALLLLFAVVWSTDIAGYFAGRAIGGAKLWPRVSPKKTWSGAIVGAIVAMIAGVLVGAFTGVKTFVAIACVALLLSICSQGGDLLESAVKRRFGSKDASHVIPGHGGLMDRLDGFVTAALVALLIGFWRGGILTPAGGLLLW